MAMHLFYPTAGFIRGRVKVKVLGGVRMGEGVVVNNGLFFRKNNKVSAFIHLYLRLSRSFREQTASLLQE